MSYITKKSTRIALAWIVALALVFSMSTLLPSGKANAAGGPTVLTVEFKTGDTVTKTVVYDQDDLDDLAAADTSTRGYLAWDTDKYKTYTTNNYIEIQELLKNASGDPDWVYTSSMTLLVNAYTRTNYGYQNVKNARFYPDTTSKAAINTNALPSPMVLALSGGVQDVTTTAGINVANYTSADETFTTPALLAGILSQNVPGSFADYVQSQATFGTQDRRNITTGVSKITVLLPGPISEFGVYSAYGNITYNVDPASPGAYTLEKQYSSRAELEAVSKTAQLNYQWGSTSNGWTLASTNQYVPLFDMLLAEGFVFNEGDILRLCDIDGNFQTTINYDTLTARSYFYPGTTPTNLDLAGAVAAPPVLSISRVEQRMGAGDMAGVMTRNIPAADFADKSGRILVGASPTVAAGNPLVSGADAIAIIKDVKDEITSSNITLDNTSYAETGAQIKPVVTIKHSGQTLTEGRDYTVSYGANIAGKGSVTVAGAGNFIGSATTEFDIVKTSIANAVVKPAKASYVVTGKKIAPAVTVTLAGKVLRNGTDYSVAYSNNTKVGTAKITVTAKGIYTGTNAKATFKITAPTVAKTAKVKAKGQKKAIKFSWKKNAKATGYQIQYGTNKKVTKGKKVVNINKASTISKTVKKLKAKKTYYYKVRTVNKIAGKSYYSKWSKVYKVKTK